MKKQKSQLTEEEVNSLMKQLQNLEIEDMADRAKIKERSDMLEQRDNQDIQNLMEKGGKVSHKKGGGFTYKVDGNKRTMSEYMKEQLGGREFLEGNFQGGGSIQDIMLMNINPMTAQASAQPTQPQQPMDYGGYAKKQYQNTGSVRKPREVDFKWGKGGAWKYKGEEKYKEALAAYEASIAGEGTPSPQESPNQNSPLDIQNPNTTPDDFSLMMDDISNKNNVKNINVLNNPLTAEILDQSELQRNPASNPTVENVDPLTKQILDPSELQKNPAFGPRPEIVDANNNQIPDYIEKQESQPMGPLNMPSLEPMDVGPLSTTGGLSPDDLLTGPVDIPEYTGDTRDLDEQAAERYNMDDPTNYDPNTGVYSDDQGNELKWNNRKGTWAPSKPRQTIKDLLNSMNINKETFPDILGASGAALKGLGPLATTLKVGQDTDEVNYFKDIEEDSIKDIEKGMDVFDKGKEEARRSIERQARQGKMGLQDYVINAQQRRAGSRAYDVAAMEQIPLSDLRFDTAKSQLYSDIAKTRLQGDIYDYTGETATDERLDKNRDNYYANISENLTTLGTEMQGQAKNMNQKKLNTLKELAYLNNMGDTNMQKFIIGPDGNIMENPDYVGTGA